MNAPDFVLSTIAAVGDAGSRSRFARAVLLFLTALSITMGGELSAQGSQDVTALPAPAGTSATTPPRSVVTVHPDRRFQTMEGWGGHVYGQANAYISTDTSFLDDMLVGLATTHMRVRSVWDRLEVRNDNDDPELLDRNAIAAGDSGLVHEELLLLRELHSRGIRLFFAAWRFPSWMIGRPADWRPTPDHRPALPESMEEEFLESMTAYLTYARDRYGVTFEGVSIANEPDIGIYISGLTPERLLRLTQGLRQRLEKERYTTRFYLPDVAAADSISVAYTRAYFSLPGAKDLAASVAYHTYRRSIDNVRFFRDAGKKTGLPVWAMEQNETHLAVEDRHQWPHALRNAECLHDILVEGNVSLSLYFAYAMASSGGLGLYLPEEKAWTPTYSMLKNFCNRIPPGSVRLDTTPSATDDSLRVVAFLRPDQKQIAVVLINSGHCGRHVRLTAAGEVLTVLEAHLSDARRRYAPLNAVSAPMGSVSVSMPERSVVSILAVRR